MHSSFLGNFQVNMIIATFRLSWIDFALLTFLLICSQSPSLDTGWLCTGVVGRAVLTGGQEHPAPAWWQREGQQGQLQQPLLSPCPQDKLGEAAQSHLLCSDEDNNYADWTFLASYMVSHCSGGSAYNKTPSVHRTVGTSWTLCEYKLWSQPSGSWSL